MCDPAVFGEKLKKIRKAKNFTQEVLAEKVGVSPQAVSKWESGECLPDLYNIKLLSKFYRMSLDDLLNLDGNGNEKINNSERIIIKNVKKAKTHWNANLNKHFDPNGKHKYSFEFQRSDISKPFAQGWGKLETYFITLHPGKTNYPLHYHLKCDEMFYIIKGQCTLRTIDGEKTVAEGDVIVFPPGEQGAHQLINNSDEPVVYIDVKVTDSPDVVIMPDSEKFLIMSDKIFNWYKLDSNVNYLTDE